METAKIDIKILLLSLAAVILAELGAKAFVSWGIASPMVLTGAARLIQIFLILMIVVTWGKGAGSLGLSPHTIFPGFKKGLLWSVAFGMIAAAGFGILYLAGVDPLELIHTRLPEEKSGIILFFLIGGAVAPVAEEVLFRGVIYGFFRRWGVIIAIILSTALFVLSHAIFSRIPLTQAVGGIVFALAYEIEGSLMVPITIHILGNLAIFIVGSGLIF
ncbi:MAG: type II CAAX endopeptidase family protein [Thermodesulfobacteriota bacterium]|nr:type II CAAX endopeptidase family protein [Thermodesulfobacteriota bacterium]